MGLTEAIQAAKNISQQPVRPSLGTLVETAQKQASELVISEDTAEEIVLDSDLRSILHDARQDRAQRIRVQIVDQASLAEAVPKAQRHALAAVAEADGEAVDCGELMSEIHAREVSRKQQMLDELEQSPFAQRDQENRILVQGTPIKHRYQLTIEALAAELQDVRNREKKSKTRVR